MYRVTKQGGIVVWVVADATVNYSETGTSFRQALGFKDAGFNLLDTMIWVKTGGGAFGSCYCYLQNTEYMFVLCKGKPKTTNLIEDHKNINYGGKHGGRGRRNSDGVIIERKPYMYKEYSKRNNWWYYPRYKSYGNHPAAFPEPLARDHILSWSNPGDIVLDPFMGSGTTAKAALLSGRNYLGFDVSREYCEIAQKRLAEIQP